MRVCSRFSLSTRVCVFGWKGGWRREEKRETDALCKLSSERVCAHVARAYVSRHHRCAHAVQEPSTPRITSWKMHRFRSFFRQVGDIDETKRSAALTSLISIKITNGPRAIMKYDYAPVAPSASGWLPVLYIAISAGLSLQRQNTSNVEQKQFLKRKNIRLSTLR